PGAAGPAAASERAAAARFVFGASKIGHPAPPAPATAPQSLPAVIVLRLAANVDHRVDEARAADAATTRLVAPPAAKSGLRQRFVGVVPLALEGNDAGDAERHAGEQARTVPTGLDNCDRPVRPTLRQPGRGRASAGTCANDDVVDLVQLILP